MADPGESQASAGAGGIGRSSAILAELADAFGAALAILVEEQGARLAGRASTLSEAARSAARSLDRSDNRQLARRIDRAARRIDAAADLVRERNWRAIGDETADFARRRPMLFGLGAVAAGFLAVRLLAPSPARGGYDRQPPAAGRPPEAGIAKGDRAGSFVGEAPDLEAN